MYDEMEVEEAGIFVDDNGETRYEDPNEYGIEGFILDAQDLNLSECPEEVIIQECGEIDNEFGHIEAKADGETLRTLFQNTLILDANDHNTLEGRDIKACRMSVQNRYWRPGRKVMVEVGKSTIVEKAEYNELSGPLPKKPRSRIGKKLAEERK